MSLPIEVFTCSRCSRTSEEPSEFIMAGFEDGERMILCESCEDALIQEGQDLYDNDFVTVKLNALLETDEYGSE